MQIKFRILEIVLGALLAVAIFAMGLVVASSFSPAQPQYSADQKKTDKSADTERVKHGFWEKAADDPVAYFTLWLVAFTGILAVSTIGLWAVTYFTLRHGRDTAERQLRAYVTLETGHIELAENETAFIFNAKLKNSGATPAYNFSAWAEGDIFTVDSDPFPTEPPKLPPTANRSIVGPNAGITIDSPKELLTATNLAAIRSGTYGLFMWGGAEYVDVFKRPRYFMFRAMMTGQDIQVRTSFSLGKTQNIMGWWLTPHPKGYVGN